MRTQRRMAAMAHKKRVWLVLLLLLLGSCLLLAEATRAAKQAAAVPAETADSASAVAAEGVGVQKQQQEEEEEEGTAEEVGKGEEAKEEEEGKGSTAAEGGAGEASGEDEGGVKDGGEGEGEGGEEGEKEEGESAASERAGNGRKQAAATPHAADGTKGTQSETKKGSIDISPDGACKKEISSNCPAVGGGEQQKSDAFYVSCIVDLVKAEREGEARNVTYSAVSDECKAEVRAFKVEMYKNLNMNKKLAESCKEDIAMYCDDDFLYPEPGNVLACLRETKQVGKLSDSCKEEVDAAEMDAANDIMMDPQLNEICGAEAQRLCSAVQPGEGRIQNCLREQRNVLAWDCQAELFRQEVENADDIRLNVRLFKACLDAKHKFCPDVTPGDARVKDCLEAHRDEPDFSPTCKNEFEQMMIRRATDFRLDSTLRKFCKQDISEICYPDAEDITDVANWDSKVIECLQDYREELRDPKCRQQVHQLTKRASEDIRFDRPLAEACQADRSSLCKDVPDGHASVFLCLQENREQLKDSCRSALFEQEVRFAEDIDFKFPLRQACSEEIVRFCKDTSADGGDVIKCLAEHSGDADMGKACRAEVKKDELRSAEDYRLNYKLNKACFNDVQKVCLHACDKRLEEKQATCGGAVLKCLSEKINEVSSKACRDEVFYFEKREVNDVELDVPLQQACRKDISAFCADISRDHSRTLACLRLHRDSLSEECLLEELRFSVMEASDIRLTPTLMNACGQELQRFCKSVPPAEGQAFKCLQLSADEDGMGFGCRAEVRLQTARQADYYKLDVQLAKECEADVQEHCSDVDEGQEGHALVLKCLINKFNDVTAACQTELSYAVRMALWVYEPQKDLTRDCDDDISTFCSNSSKSATESNSAPYGQCLMDATGLSEECQKLVSSISVEGAHVGGEIEEDKLQETLAKLAKLQLAAASGGKSSEKGLVLKGWIAFIAITALTAVLLGVAYALYRKFFDPTRNYTLVMKAGDV